MKRVRLGYVKYLNTLPLVAGLEQWEEVELVAAVPSKLAGMLSRGEVDVALASLADFARAEGAGAPLTLLPCGMIGCDGPTLTVRMYSEAPWSETTTLHADTDSHTSVVLAQVVLAEMHRVSARVVAFDARERVAVAAAGGAPAAGSRGPGDGVAEPEAPEWPRTLLLIGDKVVTDAPPAGQYAQELDLGAAWRELTDLPFVYATWMCRRSEEANPAVRTAVDVLDRQRRRNAERLDWIIAQHAGARRWPQSLARTYVTEHLRYAVGPRERAGAERFLRAAAAGGLLPACEPRWLD